LELPEVKAAIKAEAQKLVEAETGGLKKKNDELLDEVKDLKKKFDGFDPEEYKQLKAAQRNKEDQDSDPVKLRERIEGEFQPKLTKAEQERDEALKKLNDNIVEHQLSTALADAGVAKEFIRAVKADMSSSKKVEVKDGGVIIDGKPVADFVKTWAAEDGKSFIAARDNSGGGSGGGEGGGAAGGKKISDMTVAEKAEAMSTLGQVAYLAKSRAEQQSTEAK
jgi:hypothetical protein